MTQAPKRPIRKLQYLRKKILFSGSAAYWERRYAKGRDSGAGSYGKYADFKAEVLNGFCQEHDIQSVTEFGCGDGNQLKLMKYKKYIGLDVAKTAVKHCMELFKDDKSKSFFYYDTFSFRDNAGVFKSQLAISLDVLFHLVEPEVYRQYLSNLFASAEKYVIILSSDEMHKKHYCIHIYNRKFTDDVKQWHPEWKLVKTVDNAYKPENSANFYFYEKA